MMVKKWRCACLLVTLLAVPAAAVAVEPPAAQKGQQEKSPQQKGQKGQKGITVEADRMLKQMADYLAGLQSFSVDSTSVDEIVSTSGQKIQLVASSRVMVTRPNRMRSEQVGAANALSFTYDGKTMSLYCKANNTYATAPAPATLDATIDAVRKQYSIDAPGADLLYSRPYEILTEQVKGGQVIGRETVDGVVANHLAFEGESVDWQIWIKDGPEPLPLRYVITTKTVKNQPQFTVQLSRWETRAKVDEAQFDFRPPPGATKVDAFPTACQAQG